MDEAGRPLDPTGDEIALAAMVTSLREQGADRFDPIRFRFIAALAGRAEAYDGDARRAVEARLAKALADFAARFQKAREGSAGTRHGVSSASPSAGDSSELRHGTGSSPLAELMAYMACQADGKETGVEPAEGHPGLLPPAELKSLRYFRDAWSKLSVEQQLADALAQAPQNAGPLNAHLLVLESLKKMRDISPAYLGRFMSYVDALLWLDQANGAGIPMAKGAIRTERKRKSGRAESE